MRNPGIGIFMAAVMLVSLPAMALDYVVVKSAKGTAFKPGDVLEETTVIAIKKDDAMTLIDAQGRKLLLKGPLAGSLSSITAKQNAGNGDNGNKAELGFGLSSNVIGALSNLLKTETLDSNSVGAFRSLASGDPSTDPWAIDIEQSDDHCIQQGRSATFWRADKGMSDRLILETASGAEKADIAWPADSDEVEWPLEVALNDGGDYKMQTSDSESRNLTVHMVPSDLPTRAHQAAWMAERECKQQALLLILTAEIDSLVDDLAKGGQF